MSQTLHKSAVLLAILGWLMAACAGADGPASAGQQDADAMAAAADVGDGNSLDSQQKLDAPTDSKADAKADIQPQELLPASDRPALLLLQAWAALPTEHTAAVWPGVKVLQAPTALVFFDEDHIARRAYLLAWPKPPKGATALAEPGLTQPAWRWDPAAADAFDEEAVFGELQIADTSAVLLPVSAEWLKGKGATGPWAHLVGGAAMDRWRLVEGQWPVTAPCGQPAYPRDHQAIALFLLECAVLAEAVTATDLAVAEQRLMEWYAIRADYTAASSALMTRIRHYDRVFATAWYAGRRLAILTGQRTQAQVEAEYLSWLAKPLKVPAEEFDSVVGASGWPGAAALDVVRRLGWEVGAEYQAGGSVWTALPNWGAKASTALIEQAKSRHPWAQMLGQATAVMALADGLAP